MTIRSTTILCVRRNGYVAMGSDGQVTVGTTIMKSNAKKLRRLHNDGVLAGFACGVKLTAGPMLVGGVAIAFVATRLGRRAAWRRPA